MKIKKNVSQSQEGRFGLLLGLLGTFSAGKDKIELGLLRGNLKGRPHKICCSSNPVLEQLSVVPKRL